MHTFKHATVVGCDQRMKKLCVHHLPERMHDPIVKRLLNAFPSTLSRLQSTLAFLQGPLNVERILVLAVRLEFTTDLFFQFTFVVDLGPPEHLEVVSVQAQDSEPMDEFLVGWNILSVHQALLVLSTGLYTRSPPLTRFAAFASGLVDSGCRLHVHQAMLWWPQLLQQ